MIGVRESLTLYVRQLAWLNAVPERADSDKSKTRAVSRLEALRRLRKDDHYMPGVPPVEVGAHLAMWLFEIGPVMASGMGSAPISESEMRAWQDNTCTRLTPWEARTIRALSRSYVAELSEAVDRVRPPPWGADEYAIAMKKAEVQADRQATRELAQQAVRSNRKSR